MIATETTGHADPHQAIIKMANQIAIAFRASTDPEAATADHIAKFWDPRMRKQLQAVLDAGGLGLEPIARAAAARLSIKRQH